MRPVFANRSVGDPARMNGWRNAKGYVIVYIVYRICEYTSTVLYTMHTDEVHTPKEKEENDDYFSGDSSQACVNLYVHI